MRFLSRIIVRCKMTMNNNKKIENDHFESEDLEMDLIPTNDEHLHCPHDSKEKLFQERKTEQYKSSFTVHGLSKICLGNRAESIFWLVILLLGFAYGIYVVQHLVKKYLLYEIYSEVYQKVTTKNYFPSITFCDFSLITANYFKYCGSDHFENSLYKDLGCNLLLQPHPEIDNILKGNPYQWSNGFYHVTACHTWDSQFCSNDKFLKSLHRHNHACFTWNHDGTLADSYSHATIQFQINKTSGRAHDRIMALVHDPGTLELDLTNRFYMEPSKSYELRVTKTSINRLPHPFPNKCVKKSPNQIFPGEYSRRVCMDSLNYINIYKKCGDIMDYHKPLIPKNIIKQYKQNRSRAEVSACFLKISGTKFESIDECPFPCNEIEYQSMTTSHELDGKNDAENSSIYRVDVQLQNVDSYRVIEEKQLYTWEQVLGEVGGLLGLLIGASFISFIEILAYIYLCAIQKYFAKSNCINAESPHQTYVAKKK